MQPEELRRSPPSHLHLLSNRQRSFDVLVNGVRISSPDVYLGPHIAVHGLDGTLAAPIPIPRVPSPEIQRFTNSPHLAPGSEIPSPRHHQSNSPGTGGQVGSGFRPNNPSPKSSPSPIWGSPPTQPKVWKNNPTHHHRHESTTEHKKSKKKHKCRKHHHRHHRNHKGL